MFNFAIERGLLEASPCVKVKPPGEESARERNLSDDELRVVWLILVLALIRLVVRLRFGAPWD